MYPSAKALEMAVKEAAKASPLDTGTAVAGFYYHRLLYRVFSDSNTPFVLKGGFGMLTRTIDARATRDIDLVTDNLDLTEALERLRSLVERDTGDFIAFAYQGAVPIKENDAYRNGLTVTFDAYLGGRRMLQVVVDLVTDEVPIGNADRISPADRIAVRGIPVCDYLIYPSCRAVADKVCGICERHGDRPSSRVKDLVDIVVFALTETFEGEELAQAIASEARVRGLMLGDSFSLPTEWGSGQATQYAKLAEQTHLPENVATMSGGLELAKRFLDPVLSGFASDMTWNACEWTGATIH